MEDRARQLICGATASALMLLFLGDAAAQKSQLLKNVELCNGADRTSPDIQIDGCSALIDSGEQTPQALVIAYNNRGNAYTTKGEYDRAVQDYDQSIKLDPGYARAFNNRGVAYQKKGEYDRAISDFDEAIKLDPNYASALANRAETYLGKGDYERAVRDFDEAIRVKPTLEALWNGRCWTKAIIGELQAALTDCNEALG
jgi:tetratricopeptide (TPR) repeat protein